MECLKVINSRIDYANLICSIEPHGEFDLSFVYEKEGGDEY